MLYPLLGLAPLLLGLLAEVRSKQAHAAARPQSVYQRNLYLIEWFGTHVPDLIAGHVDDDNSIVLEIANTPNYILRVFSTPNDVTIVFEERGRPEQGQVIGTAPDEITLGTYTSMGLTAAQNAQRLLNNPDTPYHGSW